MDNFLSINDVTMKFGGLIAVDSISINIKKGEIRAIIGPNGAGKTTVLNIISGFYKPTSGSIIFEGENLVGKSTYNIANQGIARTYQNIRLFKGLTVMDNILIGMHNQLHQNAIDAIISTKKYKKEENEAKEEARKLLSILNLLETENKKVKNLAYGQLKMLEIAKALALHPKLLLLDEPAAGLNPSESKKLSDLIRRIRDMGITIILIEHNMQLVMSIADTITVMNFGKKIAEGKPIEISQNEEVIEAYLGKGRVANA